jgi:hypothetical protein
MRFTPVFDTLVPDPALELLWSLEQRGVSIRIDDDVLVMKPMSLIPESDRKLIRRYRSHLLHLVRECFGQIPSARLVPTMDRHQ